jgi:PKD repeat protein
LLLKLKHKIMDAKKQLLLGKLVLLLLIFISYKGSNAQGGCNTPPNCLLNPALTANAGGNISTATINGWFISHGTPNLSLGAGHNGANQIGMWSSSGNGEGMYACYNFQQNRTYTICLWVRNTTAVNLGRLRIVAATGLVHDNNNGTGNVVPNPATSELIDNSHQFSQNWTLIQVSYTPSSNFNQLWIFPRYNGAQVNGEHYRVVVSKISILESIAPYSLSFSCGEAITLTAPNCVATEWYDPNGVLIGTGNVAIENATPEMSGTYTMYQGGLGCGHSIPVEVTVSECNCESVQLDFEAENISLDPDIYYPGIFSETSSGPGSTVSWFWDFGDGNTSNEETPQHTYPYSNATYTVCLTIIREINGQTCCKKVCKEVTVNVGAGGEGELRAPETTSVGFKEKQMEAFPNAIHFTNVTNTSNIFREYYWDFGDGTSSGNPNPNHIYQSRGIYQVCLTVKDFIYNENGDLEDKKEQQHCHPIEINEGITNNYELSKISLSPNPASNSVFVNVEGMPNAKVSLYSLAGIKLNTASLAGKNKYYIDISSISSGVYYVKVESNGITKSLKLIKE